MIWWQEAHNYRKQDQLFHMVMHLPCALVAVSEAVQVPESPPPPLSLPTRSDSAGKGWLCSLSLCLSMRSQILRSHTPMHLKLDLVTQHGVTFGYRETTSPDEILPCRHGET